MKENVAGRFPESNEEYKYNRKNVMRTPSPFKRADAYRPAPAYKRQDGLGYRPDQPFLKEPVSKEKLRISSDRSPAARNKSRDADR